jgi:hypothetical protein
MGLNELHELLFVPRYVLLFFVPAQLLVLEKTPKTMLSTRHTRKLEKSAAIGWTRCSRPPMSGLTT